MSIETENKNKNILGQMKLILLFLIFSINITPCNNIFNLKNIHKKFIFFSNQITLKIDVGGDGFAIVLYDSSKTSPSEVELNGRDYGPISGGRIDVRQTENTVILKFSSPLTDCEKMFKGCSRITSKDFEDFDSSEVSIINNMFEECKHLRSINFGNFDTSKVTQMKSVFMNCEELESLDLSKFDTSNVLSFEQMFEYCKNLKSLDLSHFDTSSCTNFYKTFYHCEELQHLYLTNFNTSIVDNMGYMFSDCYWLYSLNLSSFNTKEVANMENMFYHCHSIESLDLTTFDLKSKCRLVGMFSNCKRLKNVKINSNFILSDRSSSYYDMTEETPTNLIFCVEDLINSKTNTINSCTSCSINKTNLELYLVKMINLCCYPSCQDCEEQGNANYHKCKTCKSNYNLEININNYKNCYISICSNLFRLDNDNNIICIGESTCPNEYNKLIENKKQCIQSCDLDNEYKYDYENKCYKNCPEGTEESTTLLLCEKKQAEIVFTPENNLNTRSKK